MVRLSDSQVAVQLSQLLKTPFVDPVEQALRQARGAPQAWRQATSAQMVKDLRRRFDMTQRQLATLAGVPHSKVDKIERGQDVELGTLRQIFAGFGCGLVILPLSRLSAEELWRRTFHLWGEGYIPRRRRYSRR